MLKKLKDVAHEALSCLAMCALLLGILLVICGLGLFLLVYEGYSWVRYGRSVQDNWLESGLD